MVIYVNKNKLFLTKYHKLLTSGLVSSIHISCRPASEAQKKCPAECQKSKQQDKKGA